MSINAIETHYNGYLFRSRLEARWAVFFDAGGIKYNYEEQGYKNEAGEYYLPDFFLPEMSTHVEVKPNTKAAIKDIERAARFIEWGGPIRRILILSDIPEASNDNTCWHFPCLYFNGLDECADVAWWFFEDLGKGLKGKLSHANYQKPFRFNGAGQIRGRLEHGNPIPFAAQSDEQWIDDDFKDFYYDAMHVFNKTTNEAIRAAREARFEHGETPKVVRRNKN